MDAKIYHENGEVRSLIDLLEARGPVTTRVRTRLPKAESKRGQSGSPGRSGRASAAKAKRKRKKSRKDRVHS